MSAGGSAHYRDDAGEEYHRSVHGSLISSEKVYWAKAKLARYRYFRDLDLNARVLDVGVGTGFTIAALPNVVKHGFDVSSYALKVSSAHGIQTYDRLDGLADDSYDLVVCRHVLEHVPDPIELLARLVRKAKPEGEILVIIPIENSRRRFSGIPNPDTHRHLWAWNLQHFVNLIAEVSGLELVQHRYYFYSGQEKLRSLAALGPRPYSVAVSIAGRFRRQGELVLRMVVGDRD